MVFREVRNRQPWMLLLTTVYLLSILAEFVAGQNTSGKNSLSQLGTAKEVTKLKNYLGRFGYVRDYTAPPAEVKYGLKQFQMFANLKVTGKLDDATLKKMNDPRCGLKDPIKLVNVTRRKRYNLQGTKWRKSKLTWKYDIETQDLDRDTVRRTMRNAMQLWSDKTNIEFEETSDKDADIIVQFVTYKHNDPFRFDGRGGTLAHAFYPLSNTGLAGDVHFDDGERFTVGVNDPNGKDLMWVATHELGHSLGLDHTPVEGAIMYPWYQGYKENVELAYDDIIGIQNLYGGKRKTTPPTTTKPPTTLAPTTTRRQTTLAPTTTRRIQTLPTREPPTTPCPKSPISAVWFLPKYKFFVLITDAQKLYFIKPNGDKRAGPIPAKYYFPRNRVKGGIDSAFTHDLVLDDRREYTIIFSGSRYVLYFRFLYKSGPHSIYDGRGPLRLNLPRYVRKVDAAFTWHKNGKVYFFANMRYWRYDIIRKSLDTGYPKLIRDGWRGVRRSVNAAFRSKTDGRTMLFSGDKVYRMNDRAVHIEFGYPRNVGQDLFYCKNPKGAISVGGSKLKVERMADGKDP